MHQADATLDVAPLAVAPAMHDACEQIVERLGVRRSAACGYESCNAAHRHFTMGYDLDGGRRL